MFSPEQIAQRQDVENWEKAKAHINILLGTMYGDMDRYELCQKIADRFFQEFGDERHLN